MNVPRPGVSCARAGNLEELLSARARRVTQGASRLPGHARVRRRPLPRAKGVPWSQLPLYTVNKAWAVTGVILAGFALLTGLRARRAGPDAAGLRAEARELGVFAVGCGGAHAIASSLLLRPRYFPSIFEPDEGPTWNGAASMAAGVLALLPFLQLAVPHAAADTNGSAGRARLVVIALFLSAAHAAFQGADTWLRPASWPWALPPLTLIGCLCAAGAALVALRRGG